MEKEYSLINGIPQSLIENAMPNPANQFFLDDPNCSAAQFPHFNSASLPPMAPSSCALAGDCFLLGELIGKLGGIPQVSASPHPYTQMSTDTFSGPCHDPIDMTTSASNFSCFGSTSFNARASPPIGRSNAALLHHRFSSPAIANAKLSRILSSPCLKRAGSLPETMNCTQASRPFDAVQLGSEKIKTRFSGSCVNSNGEPSVSEQMIIIPGSKTSNELDHRKRKASSSVHSEEYDSVLAKGFEGEEEANTKRSKKCTNSGKAEAEEPPKDYIHVRARRGQATDSHSLAERVRREKISERMKLLQGLVPGCSKVTGKALMLDEIINYVKSLQCQVELLSMKLSTVNPDMDININNLISKNMLQQNAFLQISAFYNHRSAPRLSDLLPSTDPFVPSIRRIAQMKCDFIEEFKKKDIYLFMSSSETNS